MTWKCFFNLLIHVVIEEAVKKPLIGKERRKSVMATAVAITIERGAEFSERVQIRRKAK